MKYLCSVEIFFYIYKLYCNNFVFRKTLYLCFGFTCVDLQSWAPRIKFGLERHNQIKYFQHKIDYTKVSFNIYLERRQKGAQLGGSFT